jgi:YegS/Rv2252/BmrU family lipid kinase
MSSLWIVNPTSGRGRGRRVAERLPKLLAERGMAGDVVQTSGPGEAVSLAKAAARPGGRIFAVGGDGTVHEVVNGLAGTGATFGLVPVGSGNDFARALGIPATIEGALEIIGRGRTARIDLGRFDDRWFANSVGVGFEAQVTIESRSIRRLRGFAIYVAALAKAMLRLRCPDLRIRTDDATFEGRRLLVSVGNGPRVGGGFLLTPDARLDDGWLDVCIAEAMGRLSVLRILPGSLDGTHVRHAEITMTRTRRLVIESSEGFPFHADGEVVDACRRRLEISIVPGALEVIR